MNIAGKSEWNMQGRVATDIAIIIGSGFYVFMRERKIKNHSDD
ncbi:hypothetical protein ACLBWS_02570 [Brucellaceae bacterium D45D]